MSSNAEATSAAPVVVERHDAVALVRLSRPEKRNALATELLGALAGALEELDRDPAARVAVVTGGPEVFASGADVRELRDIAPAAYAASERVACWRRLNALELPLVAAVAGVALGGGCELALLCDLVVAGDDATFGQPEVALGILPAAGGTQRWARAAGRYRAAEVVLGGRKLDAIEARDAGLVATVVPSERIEEAGLALAAKVAAGAPLALRAARAAVRASEELPLSAALEAERARLLTLLSTEDHREGIDALLERRKATFEGR
jgi:enoyl-CoA hydratase